MSEENEHRMSVVRRGSQDLAPAMDLNSIKEQVDLVRSVMASVMKNGEHYGTIPGCGDKKALLQPGAQTLGMTFRLMPKYDIERSDLDNGHREYEITCSLYTANGEYAGAGVGCATTMESRYRYRSEVTDRKVPKEYWDNRDKSLLGGSQYSVKKVDKTWFITEKIDHDNPADYYNTVKKIAKKRAYVDSILNTLACSDVFTQDVGDDDEEPDGAKDIPDPIKKPGAKKESSDDTISEKQSKMLFAKMKAREMTDAQMQALVFGEVGVTDSRSILKSDMDKILKAIEDWEELPY